ncbi:MAG TPA: SPW repeat protein [Micromonosporaceae bacterium]|nr:SPW repeat protein [Micromonosporaceae bacterium]
MAMDVTPWRRWQDWVTTAAGAFLALSPIWFDVDAAGAWAMIIVGVVMVAFGVVALARPGLVADEMLAVASGVVAFIAPWVFSFTDYTAASWTAWVVGVVVVASALWALPASRAVHHRQIAGHAS